MGTVDRLRGFVGEHVTDRLPAPVATAVRRAAHAGRLHRALRRANRSGPPVLGTVHPADAMYDPQHPGHYFAVGRSALAAVQAGLRDAGVGTPTRILDLPCGHGRVLRHLVACYPAAELVACDLDAEAVAFCRGTFGVRGVVASDDLEDLARAVGGGFDLVWVGSLLTHLDAPRWEEHLAWWRDRLRPGGALIVTTHGDGAAAAMRAGDRYALGPADAAAVLGAYERHGFGYADYPDASGYGISLTSPAWVAGAVAAVGGLGLVRYDERAWFDHHDVITLQAPGAAPAAT